MRLDKVFIFQPLQHAVGLEEQKLRKCGFPSATSRRRELNGSPIQFRDFLGVEIRLGLTAVRFQRLHHGKIRFEVICGGRVLATGTPARI